MSSMSGHQRAHRGATDGWLTPPEIIHALGPFDLDPCAADPRPWDTARHHYVKSDDGLALPWHGFVWCNPPYGPDTWTWLERCAEHRHGIALIFARTETRGFFDTAWGGADAALFLRGRLHFHHPDGTRAKANSGAPSVLLGYGREATRRLATCRLGGALVPGWAVIESEDCEHDHMDGDDTLPLDHPEKRWRCVSCGTVRIGT